MNEISVIEYIYINYLGNQVFYSLHLNAVFYFFHFYFYFFLVQECRVEKNHSTHHSQFTVILSLITVTHCRLFLYIFFLLNYFSEILTTLFLSAEVGLFLLLLLLSSCFKKSVVFLFQGQFGQLKQIIISAFSYLRLDSIP